jgi:tetratricopeptide (TPR) repeat protein
VTAELLQDPDPRAGGAGCPDAELLAQYLDGTLEAGSRDAIESHLTDCARCRFALGETMSLFTAETAPSSGPVLHPRVVPFRRRRWRAAAAAGLATAAALTVLARVAPQWTPWGADRANPPELQKLIATVANEPTRPVEGRLTGGFAYGLPPTFARSSAPEVSPDVRVAAARIEKVAAAQDTAANRAALGVAYLVTGRYDDAVRALEDAVARQPSDARFLTDLSAAYLARGRWLNQQEDSRKALAAAERAISRAPTMAEAYFNRALALDALQLDPEAKRAWGEYRSKDSAGKWSEEAATRGARNSGNRFHK